MTNLRWPTINHRRTSPFGPRASTKDKFHDGTDYGAIRAGVAGDELFAIGKGKVLFVGRSAAYGLYIIIECDNWCYLYAHMDSCMLSQNDQVVAGQIVGIMGDSGTEAVHVHVEIRTGIYGPNFWDKDGDKFKNSVDPETYFRKAMYTEDLQTVVDVAEFNSGDFWQNLIDNKATMGEVPVSIFISALAKVCDIIKER